MLRRPAARKILQSRNWSGAEWAFEFLRRNPEFVRAVGRAPRGAAELTPSGTMLIRQRGAALAKFGILYCDRADAPVCEATVIWAPEFLKDAIDARIVSARSIIAADHLMRLEAFACRKVVLSLRSGPDQLLLCDGGKRVQVNCLGSTALGDAAAILPLIALGRNFERQTLNIRRLIHLYAAGEAPDHLFKPDCKGVRLEKVLTALDGWLRGDTLRDIAAALYGERVVAEDWAPEGGYLIDRVRRSIKRGRYLMQGGYKSLLT